MKSTENVLKGFEWEYDGTVGFARGEGYQNNGISRTIFLHPAVADIPEQLFAVKVSQSRNPNKAGRTVFKYLSIRMAADQNPVDLAPSNVTLDTELSEIKSIIMSKLQNLPGASVSLNISLKGKFTSIACADGTFKLYDEDEPDFKTDDPKTTGNAPYYIKSDAHIHVKLKGADSKQNNPYIQTTLSTTSASSEIFVKPQRGAIWSPDGQAAAAPEASGAPAEPVW